jgi:ADP-ribose pyrophosphatase YjhB (NUDIX family)
MPPPFQPPRAATTQALGPCFTANHRVVLVSSDGVAWTLPGVTLEPGETAAEALKREVRDEAGAEVRQSIYLG